MLAQCKSTFDLQAFRLHHNFKIDIPRFEQGKRGSQLRADDEGAQSLGALGEHLTLLVPCDRELLEEVTELEAGELSAFENSFNNPGASKVRRGTRPR